MASESRSADHPRSAPGGRVTRRLVFLITGYEPLPPEKQHARFVREIGRFETTWGVKAKVSDAEGLDGPLPRWTVETTAPDWRVDTDLRLFDWHEVVAADFSRAEPRRILDGVMALADFVLTGTLFRYIRYNFRYGLFFLYPLVLLGLIAAAGIYSGIWYAGKASTAPLLGFPVGFTVSWILYRMMRDRLFLAYILDDWSFARDLVRGRRPDLDARLDQFATSLTETLATTKADEVVLVGHSLGAALMVQVLARVLRIEPRRRRRTAPHGESAPPQAPPTAPQRPLALMTCGSSILKIGLHPAARQLREDAAVVANNPKVFWVEYQALVDIINFYKCNPAQLMGLKVETTAGGAHGAHPQHAEGRDLPALPWRLLPHAPPVRDGQRAPLPLRLLHDPVRPGAAGDPGLVAGCGDGRRLCGAARRRAGGRGRIMTVEFAKILWLIGGVGWYVIRFPYERRNKRKNKVVKSQFDLRETLLLACSLSGLGIVPLIYVFSGFPAFADYSFHWLQAGAGAVVMVAALAMFRLSHRDLGRNWSVSLELHDFAQPGDRGKLSLRPPPDVHGVLAVGAGAGAAVAELDRRPGRSRRFRHRCSSAGSSAKRR